MKLYFKVFLIGCLFLLGCSNAQNTTSQSDTGVSAESSSSTEARTESGTKSGAEISIESNVEDFDMNNYDTPEEVAIESGQVLYDSNGLKVTTDSLESDSSETFLVLNLENTSGEDISITCESSSINGFMIDSAFSIDLPEGESILAGIPFSNNNLNACDITTITEIDFTLSIYDANEYTFLYETDRMDIQTNQYGYYEQAINTSGTSVYNENDIQIISKGFVTDDNWGDVLVLLVINQADQNIHLGLNEGMCTADGVQYEIAFGCDVPAGHNAVQYMYFQDADGSGTSEVTTASASFTLSDTDSWEVIDNTPEITFVNSQE